MAIHRPNSAAVTAATSGHEPAKIANKTTAHGGHQMSHSTNASLSIRYETSRPLAQRGLQTACHSRLNNHLPSMHHAAGVTLAARLGAG